MNYSECNNAVNQRIKGQFVDREVLCCQSSLVDEALRQGFFQYEDIQNLESWRVEDPRGYENEFNYDELEAEKERVDDFLSKAEDKKTELEEWAEQLVEDIDELRSLQDQAEHGEEIPETPEWCETEINEKEKEGERVQAAIRRCDNIISKYEDYKDALDNAESEYKEVYEWWIVDSHLLEKLKDKGEVILENDYGEWWGRCCSGQAIKLDGVISEICHGMEILQGQRYSWEEKA